MCPCQINQPRKIKLAKRFLFSHGLIQRSISVVMMPVCASPRPSARTWKRRGGYRDVASTFGVTFSEPVHRVHTTSRLPTRRLILS